jgi:hypothetical protein
MVDDDRARGTHLLDVPDDDVNNNLATLSDDTNSKIPPAIRAVARDVAGITRDAKDLTLAADMISPLAGSLMQLWTHTEWDVHTSFWRYWWHIKNWHMSSVLKRIRAPVAALALYAVIVRWLNECCEGRLSLPLAAVSLQGASIGLLLVFRTNQVASRVTEARALWGAVSRHCVTIADVVVCHVDTARHADAVSEVGRLLASCPLLLKAGLRKREATLPSGAGGAHDLVHALLAEHELAEWVLHGAATRTAHKATAKKGVRNRQSNCGPRHKICRC